MFASGSAIEVFGVNWMTTMHQEIPEEKFSRVSAYDWFGSVSMLPLATAVAGPVESAFGRTSALWGCATLVVLVTTAVLAVPDVRHLTRKPSPPKPGSTTAPPNTTSPSTPAAV